MTADADGLMKVLLATGMSSGREKWPDQEGSTVAT
jgi:hypothetical protein